MSRKILKESDLKKYIYKQVLSELSFNKIADANFKSDDIARDYEGNDDYKGEYGISIESYADDIKLGDAVVFLRRLSSGAGNKRAELMCQSLEKIIDFIQRKIDQRENFENEFSNRDKVLRKSLSDKLSDDEYNDAELSKYDQERGTITRDERKNKYGLSDDELDFLDGGY